MTPGRHIGIAKSALAARLTLRTMGDEPAMNEGSAIGSADHRRGVRMISIRDEFEWFHVLIDSNEGNKRLKKKAMTRSEARKRNLNLEGTGFSWARIGAT